MDLKKLISQKISSVVFGPGILTPAVAKKTEPFDAQPEVANIGVRVVRYLSQRYGSQSPLYALAKFEDLCNSRGLFIEEGKPRAYPTYAAF